jgi:hypothetical protein
MPRFLKSLGNVCASDIVRSVDCCGLSLGLEETRRFPAAGTPECVELSVGGSTLAVSSPAGAPIIREPLDGPAGNRCAYAADPDGNWISL